MSTESLGDAPGVTTQLSLLTEAPGSSSLENHHLAIDALIESKKGEVIAMITPGVDDPTEEDIKFHNRSVMQVHLMLCMVGIQMKDILKDTPKTSNISLPDMEHQFENLMIDWTGKNSKYFSTLWDQQGLRDEDTLLKALLAFSNMPTANDTLH